MGRANKSSIEIIKRCQNFALRIVGVTYRHDRNDVLMMTPVQNKIFEFVRKRRKKTPVQKQYNIIRRLKRQKL